MYKYWAVRRPKGEKMRLEDMRVGAFVKCTKPEWDCYGDIFEITKRFPYSNDEWEITRRPYTQMRQSGKKIKALNTVSIISRKTLQHNFKLYKVHTLNKTISISFYANGVTSIESDGQIRSVNLYHEDKYDEFVGAVEALAKLYGRKSPFDEIEELKDVTRAAEEPIEATEVSDEWLTVEKEEEPKPHSPVDDMDLTPPLEKGCLIKLKDPYDDKLKNKWFRVDNITKGKFDTMIGIIVFEYNDLMMKTFSKDDVEVVKEKYHGIWNNHLKYRFGDRVVLIQTGCSAKRKSYGTIIDWRERYEGCYYYIVHWDDEDVRFNCKEEVIPENYLLQVRHE